MKKIWQEKYKKNIGLVKSLYGGQYWYDKYGAMLCVIVKGKVYQSLYENEKDYLNSIKHLKAVN